jgi:hypothetical protein
MAWQLTDTLVALLVGANFGLCLYLVGLFRRVRADLAALQGAQPASEEIEATRTLLEQVAVEIGRVAEDLRGSSEESEVRGRALAERLEELAARVDRLEAAPAQTAQAVEVSPEPPEAETAPPTSATPEPGPTVDAPPAEAGDRVDRVPSPPVVGRGEGGPRDAFRKRSDRARELYAQGKSVNEIAREMRLSGGAVELILGVGERLEASAQGTE